MTLKGILVDVYKSGNTDCTLGGVSTKNETLLLVGEGIEEVFEDCGRYPIVRLMYKQIRSTGSKYYYCEPLQERERKYYAAGGNFAYSCDSRFREICEYPISIHDRDLSKERR